MMPIIHYDDVGAGQNEDDNVDEDDNVADDDDNDDDDDDADDDDCTDNDVDKKDDHKNDVINFSTFLNSD